MLGVPLHQKQIVWRAKVNMRGRLNKMENEMIH